jgi:FAD/FMN-containing dehydrogenase
LIYHDDDDPNLLLEPYNRDWTGHYMGSSNLVLLPASTLQVSKILQHCNKRRLAVVPQGGNTGLVGGSVVIGRGSGDGVLLNTSRLNRILAMDRDEGILKCQSGCVLQDLQDHAALAAASDEEGKGRSWLVPIDLGAKGTCQIGGNLSTNAGGVYYYRYGSLAANLLGLQLVKADGQVLELGSSRVRKDNTGYKLQNLMLGAEGTLGIVTEVALQCQPVPSSRQAAWLACPSFAGVVEVRRAARTVLGEILAAMEWMSGPILDIVLQHQPSLRSPVSPLASSSSAYSSAVSPHHHVLIETHGSNERHDADKMEAFLAIVLERGWAVDGVLAQNLQQHSLFWNLRESCNPAMAAGGYTYKYDVSLPSSALFDEFVSSIEGQVRREYCCDGTGSSSSNGGNGIAVASWGHILDGNLHLNFHRKGQRHPDPDLANLLDSLVYESVIARGGSISAEHGIGVAKKAWLSRVHNASTLQAMRDLKRLYDPNNILNPGKIF